MVNISGHRLGTMEIESAIVAHEYIAEAAVVSYKHEIKGEAIHAFVTLKDNFKDYSNTDFSNQLRNWVKEKIGSIAKPDRVSFSDSLPIFCVHAFRACVGVGVGVGGVCVCVCLPVEKLSSSIVPSS